MSTNHVQGPETHTLCQLYARQVDVWLIKALIFNLNEYKFTLHNKAYISFLNNVQGIKAHTYYKKISNATSIPT